MSRVRPLVWSLLAAAGLLNVAQAQDLPFPWPEPSTSNAIDPLLAPSWTAWGGRVTLRFSNDVLQSYGASVHAVGSAKLNSDGLRLPVYEQGGMNFKIGGAQFQGFTDGSLQVRGGFRVAIGERELLLKDLRLIPRKDAGSDDWQLDLVDSQGTVWFNNDHVHYQLSPDRTQIEMFNMDLRATPAFAAWLGDSNLLGHTVGMMAVSSSVRVNGDVSQALKSCTAPNWPNSNNPGGPWLADVTLTDMSTIDYKRCSGCTGQNGAGDGTAVFAPNATLRNSNNANTAEVPWYGKFSGYRPPYNNDQHPFLAWNLYRIDASGRIEQIGRSGIKHAFLTLNTGCADATCNSVSGAILGKNCGDVYSSGNNDSGTALGPRSELVPAKGIWGRCGSVYDANCDHVNDNPSDDGFQNRLTVRESQLRSAANPGASYFMESWYIIRDDINIYNTMGGRQVTPAFGANWQLQNTAGKPFSQGPIINQWVNPASPGQNAANTELVAPEGRVRVAVKASNQSNGVWRYDYAVMNFDFAREDKQLASVPGNPSAEVYRVNRAFGFSGFQVPTVGADPTILSFSDGDLNAGNDWTAQAGGGNVSWAGVQSNALNWATMYFYSLESEAAPGATNVVLSVLDAGAVPSYSVASIGPTGVVGGLFRDSLE